MHESGELPHVATTCNDVSNQCKPEVLELLLKLNGNGILVITVSRSTSYFCDLLCTCICRPKERLWSVRTKLNAWIVELARAKVQIGHWRTSLIECWRYTAIDWHAFGICVKYVTWDGILHNRNEIKLFHMCFESRLCGRTKIHGHVGSSSHVHLPFSHGHRHHKCFQQMYICILPFVYIMWYNARRLFPGWEGTDNVQKFQTWQRW